MPIKKTKKRPGPGKFFLCGAGINFLEDMTLETVRVLRSCDVVFYIQKDIDRVRKALETVCPGPRIAFSDYETTPRPVLCRLIEAELKKGRRVAYLDYGNPLLFSEGMMVTDHCRRRGYSFRVVPALSAVESLFGLLVERSEWLMGNGFSVWNADDLRAQPTTLPTSRPLLIFCASEALKRFGKEILAPIERCYPPGHPVYLVKAEDVSKTAFRTLTVRDMRASAGLIVHRMSIILPPIAPPAGTLSLRSIPERLITQRSGKPARRPRE